MDIYLIIVPLSVSEFKQRNKSLTWYRDVVDRRMSIVVFIRKRVFVTQSRFYRRCTFTLFVRVIVRVFVECPWQVFVWRSPPWEVEGKLTVVQTVDVWVIICLCFFYQGGMRGVVKMGRPQSCKSLFRLLHWFRKLPVLVHNASNFFRFHYW